MHISYMYKFSLFPIASFEGLSLAPSFASDTTLNIDHTPRADAVCSKLYELVQMLERQQQELKLVYYEFQGLLPCSKFLY